MSLIYMCDQCGLSEDAPAIPGMYTEVADCLPMGWALCAGSGRSVPVRTLCGPCYVGHKHGA